MRLPQCGSINTQSEQYPSSLLSWKGFHLIHDFLCSANLKCTHSCLLCVHHQPESITFMMPVSCLPESLPCMSPLYCQPELLPFMIPLYCQPESLPFMTPLYMLSTRITPIHDSSVYVVNLNCSHSWFFCIYCQPDSLSSMIPLYCQHELLPFWFLCI